MVEAVSHGTYRYWATSRKTKMDPQNLYNTILSFMTDGILIIYYGQEQGFSEPRILTIENLYGIS